MTKEEQEYFNNLYTKCEFDDECEVCDNPQKGSYATGYTNDESGEEVDGYICGNCAESTITKKLSDFNKYMDSMKLSLDQTTLKEALCHYLPHKLQLWVEYGKGDFEAYTLGGSDGKKVISIDHLYFGAGSVKPILQPLTIDVIKDILTEINSGHHKVISDVQFKLDGQLLWLSGTEWYPKWLLEECYKKHIDVDNLINQKLAVDGSLSMFNQKK